MQYFMILWPTGSVGLLPVFILLDRHLVVSIRYYRQYHNLIPLNAVSLPDKYNVNLKKKQLLFAHYDIFIWLLC